MGYLYLFYFHNSLIMHGIISQMVFVYVDLYLLPFFTINSDVKSAQKIVNSLINKK